MRHYHQSIYLFIIQNVCLLSVDLSIASCILTGIKVLPAVQLSSLVAISFQSAPVFSVVDQNAFHSFDSRAQAQHYILCPLLSLREFVLSETITFLSRQGSFYFLEQRSHKVVVSICHPGVPFHFCTHRRCFSACKSYILLASLLPPIDFVSYHLVHP